MSAASLGGRLRRVALRQSYAFALVLLVVSVAINYYLQPNFFQPGLLSGNLLLFVPLMLVAVGQTVVVIGGGIDLSLGAIVSMANVIIVTLMAEEPSSSRILLALGAGFGAGILAGALNGFCVAVLRFQPIVTTFATSFVFSGLALYVLPEPGGTMPPGLQGFYYTNPLGLPMVLWVVVVVLLLWNLLRSTRYGRTCTRRGAGSLGVRQRGAGLVGALLVVLYRGADGGPRGARAGSQHRDGKPDRRYGPHVAVHRGGRARGDASQRRAGRGSRLDHRGGDPEPHPEHRLLLARALLVADPDQRPDRGGGPRRSRPLRPPQAWGKDMKRIGLNPIVIALILAVILFAVGGIVQPGFASYGQAMNILRLAAFLGIVAAGQTLVIISGGEGIDLSVGAVITLGAILVFRIGTARTTRPYSRSPSRSAWGA